MAWYRLRNKEAHVFYDGKSKLKLTAVGSGDKWTAEPVEYNGKQTVKIKDALKSGYIEIIPGVDAPKIKDRFNKAAKEVKLAASGGVAPEPTKDEGSKGTDTVDFHKMTTKEELTKYYFEEYEVSEKETKKWEKFTVEEAILHLEGLEESEDESDEDTTTTKDLKKKK